MTIAINALIIAMLFMAGCGYGTGSDLQRAGDDMASSHDDHLDQESVTLFTPNLELFTEFYPLVAGDTSSFIIHLTQLDNNYSPLTDAKVELILEVDGNIIQKAECKAGIQGIYHVEISPESHGDAKIIIQINKEGFSDRFVLDHVHIYDEHGNVHAHNQQEESGQISFLKEQAWKNDFNVEPVLPQSFSPVINASGQIMAMPGEKQNLITKSNGIVLFSKRNLVQGSSVKKGELLFTISGKGFADNNISVKYHDARLQFENSKNQYQRHKNLVEENIVSKSQFIQSTNRYLADSVAYSNLEKTVSDGGLKVFAPLTGYIHELNVSEGQYTATGSLLGTISTNKIMLLKADVSQQYFKELGEISDATFRPAYSEKVYTIKELNGRLLAKASSVAENNHYMPVYFKVINDGSLLEGAYAEFYLLTEPRPGTLVVPVGSIVEEQNNFYVYLQVAGESFLKRQIRLGHTNGIYSEVLSGLKVGDRVVTKGVMLIKAASVSTEPVYSHSH